jgi:hypothetical protein
VVNTLRNNRLPPASGLNVAWLGRSQLKKGDTEVVKHSLDDAAALSTWPDYPPSPDRFDREAANAKLAKASMRNPLRKNAVC